MILSLIGFRDYRAKVRRLLAAAGHHPRAVSDRDIIAAWLAAESPAALVARLADAAKGGAA